MHGEFVNREEIGHGAKVAFAATLLILLAVLIGAGLSVIMRELGVI